MALRVAQLRADAVRRAFPAPTTLKKAIESFGFIQADPIRAPARAQDLILRHRVKRYHAGDLERRYPELDIEEDSLYAYGFLTRENWRLLHPRDAGGLSGLDRQVLELVTRKGLIHPRELEAELGRERAVNAWGGYSKATTRSLEALHYRGLVRIARRENGIRLYEASSPTTTEELPREERLRRLAVVVCRILAPLPLRSLYGALTLLRSSFRGATRPQTLVAELLRSGVFDRAEVDNVPYIWPKGRVIARQSADQVRFLAPFDPLVWDRRRFEHFWGWAYRFEAYTPQPKRVRGYYAMPLLWRDQVIGWTNAAVRKGQLHLTTGFHSTNPSDRGFKNAFDEEAERLRAFLKLQHDEASVDGNSATR